MGLQQPPRLMHLLGQMITVLRLREIDYVVSGIKNKTRYLLFCSPVCRFTHNTKE